MKKIKFFKIQTKFVSCREKKRDKDREELWTRLDKLALTDATNRDRSSPASAASSNVREDGDKARKST
jgi:hypothetical protein